MDTTTNKPVFAKENNSDTDSSFKSKCQIFSESSIVDTNSSKETCSKSAFQSSIISRDIRSPKMEKNESDSAISPIINASVYDELLLYSLDFKNKYSQLESEVKKFRYSLGKKAKMFSSLSAERIHFFEAVMYVCDRFYETSSICAKLATQLEKSTNKFVPIIGTDEVETNDDIEIVKETKRKRKKEIKCGKCKCYKRVRLESIFVSNSLDSVTTPTESGIIPHSTVIHDKYTIIDTRYKKRKSKKHSHRLINNDTSYETDPLSLKSLPVAFIHEEDREVYPNTGLHRSSFNNTTTQILKQPISATDNFTTTTATTTNTTTTNGTTATMAKAIYTETAIYSVPPTSTVTLPIAAADIKLEISTSQSTGDCTSQSAGDSTIQSAGDSTSQSAGDSTGQSAGDDQSYVENKAGPLLHSVAINEVFKEEAEDSLFDLTIF